MPNPEALRNGAEQNDDGHGFAIVADGNLIVRKSMDSDFLIAEFTRLRAKHLAGPALFHSRWGTGGTVDTRNCHPFRFGGDRRTVVGHNGVLGKEVQPDKGDKRCDTRIAAEEVIPYFFGDLAEPANRDALAEWIGGGNKFVILTANPAYPVSAYIINEDKGVWDTDGCWYSNFDYIGRPRTRGLAGTWGYGGNAYGWALDADDNDGYLGMACNYCKAGDLDVDGICLECGVCVDCDNDYTECECYTSTTGFDAMVKRHADRDEYRGLWASAFGKDDDDPTLTDNEPIVMGPRPTACKVREPMFMDETTRSDMLGIALASMDATLGQEDDK